MIYNKELIDEKIRIAIEKSEDYKKMGNIANYIPELSFD